MAFPKKYAGFRKLENEKAIDVKDMDYSKGFSNIFKKKIKTKRNKYGKI